jgi:endoglucanase
MRTRNLQLALALLAVTSIGAHGQSNDIQLNQVGFYPNRTKIAVVRGVGSIPFYVVSATSQDTLFTGPLTASQVWPYSGQSVSQGDFSSFTTPGRYRILVPGVGTSHQFDIADWVHQNVAVGALKGYYFQRASTSLSAQYAGQWARAAGHPDTAVFIHASAATAVRPESTKIKAPRGWYDAGDYNKYIVNSGISTYTLLATYESFPEYCALLRTNIPESSNAIPDILDEALWNLRWMLAMQDPTDGGVYTKLTNTFFDGWIMPFQATTARYVVMKSTGATLDFAAVTAQAARIFSAYSTQLPGLADSCLNASLAAWNWARANPAIFYNQSQMNLLYSPDITTGEYGDGNFQDEFDWAASELFVTTGQDSFMTVASPLNTAWADVPNWQNVRTLGLYTLAHHRAAIAGSVDTAAVKSRLIGLANTLRSSKNASAYGVPMGVDAADFVWGSNGVAANQGMALLVAYELTGDGTYVQAAMSNLDYLLGRNGTSYCFVTGFGSRSPLHIHHRPSQSDGVAAPVPGLLAGGPNPGQDDGQPYPSSMPGLSYTDNYLAYASNEIAINWNAPLAYLSIGIEELLSPTGLPTGDIRGMEPAVPEDLELLQNYPNPFNPQTTVEYRLPQGGFTTVQIFDLLGRTVGTLQEGWQGAGGHRVTFDASRLASGVYLCRLTALGSSRSIRMSLTK